MRDGLRSEQNRRLVFFARFDHRAVDGNLLLKNVIGPNGIQEGHVWIRRTHWHGRIPARDEYVAFEADVESYQREDGTQDLGLFRLGVLE